MNGQTELAWNMLAELRLEMVSWQKIRAQIIGFKITFVSTAIALIVANLDKVDARLLIIPALASVFFDLLTAGQSVGIKRIGSYCRDCLEPKLRLGCNWPDNEPLWHEYISSPRIGRSLPIVGHLGLTTLAFLPAIGSLLRPFQPGFSVPMIALLLALYVYSVVGYLQPQKVVRLHLLKREVRGTNGLENSKREAAEPLARADS